MAEKKTKGRQKIEMKKIEKEDDRMITFSKRRSGVYKKLSELVTLCGTEVGFLTFSGAGKPYTFGHPSFEEVANKFLNDNQEPPKDNTQLLTEAQRKTRLNMLNQRYEELVSMFDAEKVHERGLKEMTKGKELEEGWWKAPVNELDMEELERLHAAFQELHDTLVSKVIERSNGQGPSSSNMVPPLNPSEEVNPFAAAKADEPGPSSFPPGHDFGGQ